MLDVEAVVSGYGDNVVVNGVDLTVEDEEIVTVIGPNGAGKSTLLKTIVGILTPMSGEIRMHGRAITGTPPGEMIDHGICYVPQRSNVFPSLSVIENLKMGAWTQPETFEERVAEVSEVFPLLEESPNRTVGDLSGGQQKMVAIGAALMVDPDLLILDEPSAGLAPGLIDETFEKIEEINRQGKTILMVEQNARRALEASDRGVVLATGVKKLEGESAALLDSREVAELYLGG